MAGPSPYRAKGVRPRLTSTEALTTAGSNSPVLATTRPRGSTTAEIPDGAAWTTHSPSSTARILVSWSSCWAVGDRGP
jgi:hypothetical protein